MIAMIMTQMMTSISEVMETMFYLPLEIKEGGTLNTILGVKNIKKCRILFSGSSSGYLYLIVPEPTLIAMAENFLGEERKSLSPELLDGTLKEALNMIAGNTFSNLQDISFELGLPEIVDDTIPETEKNHLIIETTEGDMAVVAIIQ